jgi:hypothetical protein
MASITQTIPNYVGGISEQPDQLKFPGQVKDVVNAIPDVTRGLYKRPGSKRIGSSPLSSVQSGGSWFHYHRDEDEGSYIGQVAADGQVRVWRCSDGTLMTTAYGTGGQTAIQNYLATSEPENLQFLTINDTTFVSSRDSTNANTLVGTTGSSQAYPDAHFAFIELTRTENGRQYALNAYDNSTTTTINRATRVKIISDNLDESAGTGQCRGIGVQTFSVDSGSKKNLIFKLNILGQQGTVGGDGDSAEDFACAYSRGITLLHGGEGWVTGDQVSVTLTQAKGRTVSGSISGGNSTKGDSSATYTIEVTDHEAISVKANIKAIRPAPTPFDADTAVTVDTILGGLQAEFTGTGITATVIGNGLYLTKSSAFNIEIVEDDLMRNMGSSVNDVTLLPKQCKHGYIVKVSNARMSDEDDYYLKFEGENNVDGTGSWTECAQPGIATSFTNMPIVIQRTATTTFTVKQFTYADRAVGDDTTNPIPSFVGKRINKVLFFRNRLAFLAGENVVLCRPGTVGVPNFWSETALVVSANDPIDIACSSTFPSELFDGIDINTGLVVFSTNQQFLLSSDDTVLNPDTAKLRSIATFNYNKTVPPISLGVTIAYLDNSGKFSRFNEMANIAREGEPNVVEQSKIIPTTISKDVDLLTNSRENQIVAIGKTDSDTVIGFRYLNVGDKRQQSAWFKWKFNNPLKYHFIINDEYFFLDTDNFLQSMRLVQKETDPSIVQDNVEFLLHVDNHTTISGGSFSAATNLTTFSSVSWLPSVTSPNYDLVVVDTNTASTRVGRYAKPTLTSSNSFTVPGDWSGVTLTIGYIYEYSVKFPRVYYTRTEGQRFLSDVNSSLVLHRVKFHFGKVGLYETTLERVGKTDYTEVYESTILDEYEVSDAPYLDEFIKTIPVYEQNTNVDITLKSSHPAPSTLRAMTWEGYYSPRYYRRA